VYPILVLVYCYCTFNFDHAVFKTYLEKLPPSSFEHQARVFADPAEVALFRLSFDSLRIHTLLELALRIGMNLSFCYRFKRIGDDLVSSQHRTKRGGRHASRSKRRCRRRLLLSLLSSVWRYGGIPPKRLPTLGPTALRTVNVSCSLTAETRTDRVRAKFSLTSTERRVRTTSGSAPWTRSPMSRSSQLQESCGHFKSSIASFSDCQKSFADATTSSCCTFPCRIPRSSHELTRSKTQSTGLHPAPRTCRLGPRSSRGSRSCQ
jgi:hypothetical protein